MTLAQSPDKSPASWGRVAEEALKHPYKSGVLDLTVGTQSVLIGTIAHAPFLAVLGAPLLGFGVVEMKNHIKKCRSSGFDPH